MDLRVKFKKLHKDAVIPSYSNKGDAGLDLTAVDNGIYQRVTKEDDAGGLEIIIRTAEFRSYRTGLSVEIPEGYVGLIFPRSSISNMALSLSNAVGVIDSSYRGEISFRFRVLNDYPIRYNKGDRIGQLIILPYPEISCVEVDTLSDTGRGLGGFGSTGGNNGKTYSNQDPCGAV